MLGDELAEVPLAKWDDTPQAFVTERALPSFRVRVQVWTSHGLDPTRKRPSLVAAIVRTVGGDRILAPYDVEPTTRLFDKVSPSMASLGVLTGAARRSTSHAKTSPKHTVFIPLVRHRLIPDCSQMSVASGTPSPSRRLPAAARQREWTRG
jgi:hypothetical protein